MKSILVLLLALCFNFTNGHTQSYSTISADVVGEGQPIILIHGMSCSAEVWVDVVEHYRSDYELHLIHINGFGNKRSIDGDNILESVKDDLINYIENHVAEPPIIIGHSMGGFLGLWMASERPELIKGLLSVDGLPYFPVLQMPNITPESAKEMAANIISMSAGQTDEMRRSMSEMMVATMISNESRRAEVVNMGMVGNFDVTNKAYGEMLTTDLRPVVHQIQCPVLILGAWKAYRQYGLTKAMNQKNYEAQVEPIDHVEVLMAEDAYHFIFFDEPEWFFEQTDRFLAFISSSVH